MRPLSPILLFLPHAFALSGALAPESKPTVAQAPIQTTVSATSEAAAAAAAAAVTTAAPQLSAGQADNSGARPYRCDTAEGAQVTGAGEQRFVQTTYWACVTRGTYTHCGWHMPILDAGAGRGAWSPGAGIRAVGAAGAVALLAWIV